MKPLVKQSVRDADNINRGEKVAIPLELQLSLQHSDPFSPRKMSVAAVRRFKSTCTNSTSSKMQPLNCCFGPCSDWVGGVSWGGERGQVVVDMNDNEVLGKVGRGFCCCGQHLHKQLKTGNKAGNRMRPETLGRLLLISQLQVGVVLDKTCKKYQKTRTNTFFLQALASCVFLASDAMW